MNLSQLLSTAFAAALLCSVGAYDIQYDKVHSFAQPKPATTSLEFEDGTCRPYPAVNAAGDTSRGLEYGDTGVESCQGSSLGSQVYGRAAWHNDLWAIMYVWYFPKDSGETDSRHKWTAAVVWLDNPAVEKPKIVAVSTIGRGGVYEVATSGSDEYRNTECYTFEDKLNGTHPMLLFTSDYTSSGVELTSDGKWGEFQDLIMWEQMTEEAREGISEAHFAAPIIDEAFKPNLESASPY
ncbi:necrosis inducing-like protein NPP1 type [Phytophthora sojae]|uniref:Necrosis inducing-like protein NPP1 type n=1 Tax=Phytophthora sojae (strain P6497) TaxID=1094619 RepID=G5ADW7_PHYSP|nr:necrosis inducing-like protein NPP1 type [Phytophthora sojae]EGZ06369.1 necrosis inducing-like protein NPP1 type [Phytophthora sojae]|eukprot:XP_009538266.1 necrosis inducing-like protein NPP1 type [Phytophthora sojae]